MHMQSERLFFCRVKVLFLMCMSPVSPLPIRLYCELDGPFCHCSALEITQAALLEVDETKAQAAEKHTHSPTVPANRAISSLPWRIQKKIPLQLSRSLSSPACAHT